MLSDSCLYSHTKYLYCLDAAMQQQNKASLHIRKMLIETWLFEDALNLLYRASSSNSLKHNIEQANPAHMESSSCTSKYVLLRNVVDIEGKVGLIKLRGSQTLEVRFNQVEGQLDLRSELQTVLNIFQHHHPNLFFFFFDKTIQICQCHNYILNFR